jgi:hypothetical protein
VLCDSTKVSQKNWQTKCFIKKHGPFVDVVENFEEMARRHPMDRPFGKHKLHLMFFCSKLKWKHVIMFSF